MIFSLFLCRINQLYIDDLMISIEPERNDLQLVICSNEIDLPLFCITMSNVYFSIRIFLSLLSSSRGFFSLSQQEEAKTCRFMFCLCSKKRDVDLISISSSSGWLAFLFFLSV